MRGIYAIYGRLQQCVLLVISHVWACRPADAFAHVYITIIEYKMKMKTKNGKFIYRFFFIRDIFGIIYFHIYVYTYIFAIYSTAIAFT